MSILEWLSIPTPSGSPYYQFLLCMGLLGLIIWAAVLWYRETSETKAKKKYRGKL